MLALMLCCASPAQFEQTPSTRGVLEKLGRVLEKKVEQRRTGKSKLVSYFSIRYHVEQIEANLVIRLQFLADSLQNCEILLFFCLIHGFQTLFLWLSRPKMKAMPNISGRVGSVALS